MRKTINVPVTNGNQLRIDGAFSTDRKGEVKTATLAAGNDTAITVVEHGIAIGSPIRITFNAQKNNGIDEEAIYYVIAEDYTVDTFAFSETLAGDKVRLNGQQTYDVTIQVDRSEAFDLINIVAEEGVTESQTVIATYKLTTSLNDDFEIPITHDVKMLGITAHVFDMVSGELIYTDITKQTPTSFELVLDYVPAGGVDIVITCKAIIAK